MNEREWAVDAQTQARAGGTPSKNTPSFESETLQAASNGELDHQPRHCWI